MALISAPPFLTSSLGTLQSPAPSLPGEFDPIGVDWFQDSRDAQQETAALQDLLQERFQEYSYAERSEVLSKLALDIAKDAVEKGLQPWHTAYFELIFCYGERVLATDNRVELARSLVGACFSGKNDDQRSRPREELRALQNQLCRVALNLCATVDELQTISSQILSCWLKANTTPTSRLRPHCSRFDDCLGMVDDYLTPDQRDVVLADGKLVPLMEAYFLAGIGREPATEFVAKLGWFKKESLVETKQFQDLLVEYVGQFNAQLEKIATSKKTVREHLHTLSGLAPYFSCESRDRAQANICQILVKALASRVQMYDQESEGTNESPWKVAGKHITPLRDAIHIADLLLRNDWGDLPELRASIEDLVTRTDQVIWRHPDLVVRLSRLFKDYGISRQFESVIEQVTTYAEKVWRSDDEYRPSARLWGETREQVMERVVAFLISDNSGTSRETIRQMSVDVADRIEEKRDLAFDEWFIGYDETLRIAAEQFDGKKVLSVLDQLHKMLDVSDDSIWANVCEDAKKDLETLREALAGERSCDDRRRVLAEALQVIDAKSNSPLASLVAISQTTWQRLRAFLVREAGGLPLEIKEVQSSQHCGLIRRTIALTKMAIEWGSPDTQLSAVEEMLRASKSSALNEVVLDELTTAVIDVANSVNSSRFSVSGHYEAVVNQALQFLKDPKFSTAPGDDSEAHGTQERNVLALIEEAVKSLELIVESECVQKGEYFEQKGVALLSLRLYEFLESRRSEPRLAILRLRTHAIRCIALDRLGVGSRTEFDAQLLELRKKIFRHLESLSRIKDDELESWATFFEQNIVRAYLLDAHTVGSLAANQLVRIRTLQNDRLLLKANSAAELERERVTSFNLLFARLYEATFIAELFAGRDTAAYFEEVIVAAEGLGFIRDPHTTLETTVLSLASWIDGQREAKPRSNTEDKSASTYLESERQAESYDG